MASLVGHDQYVSWKDWTEATLVKLGKIDHASASSSDYSVSEAMDAPLNAIDSQSNKQFLRTGSLLL